MFKRFTSEVDCGAEEIVLLKMELKYCNENMYIGSISCSDATTKNRTLPRIAIGRYLLDWKNYETINQESWIKMFSLLIKSQTFF